MKLNKLNLTIAACLLYSSSVLATASNIDDDITIQENSKKIIAM